MKALWKKKYGSTKTDIKKLILKKTSASKAEQFKTKKVTGGKNGGERKVPVRREPRSYSMSGKSRSAKKSTRQPKTPALRKSLTPGTVVILLAGRHKGKRVVFLKQLQSGLLLVNGMLLALL